MTHCLAGNVDQGLVFCSDSRNNAGLDNISTYSRMQPFARPEERIFVLLSAGNLPGAGRIAPRKNPPGNTPTPGIATYNKKLMLSINVLS